MMCCGGVEDDIYSQPVNPAVPPPGRNAPGNDGERRGPAKTGAPKKALPIEIPSIPLAELKKLTGNFGQKALIGEGSYGRVFHATLSTGESAAIKKLDPSASQDSDADFETQISAVSRLKHEYFVGLLGYCMEREDRILVYQFATLGSLHDTLHGRKGVQDAAPGPALSWNQRTEGKVIKDFVKRQLSSSSTVSGTTGCDDFIKIPSNSQGSLVSVTFCFNNVFSAVRCQDRYRAEILAVVVVPLPLPHSDFVTIKFNKQTNSRINNH
ncbi:uncharacterized protein A4U43_C08F27980 [Asparagus officinalis]|nr:uncharacterized protein A4U43_C08F27980 [Asparagus officinalis]